MVENNAVTGSSERPPPQDYEKLLRRGSEAAKSGDYAQAASLCESARLCVGGGDVLAGILRGLYRAQLSRIEQGSLVSYMEETAETLESAARKIRQEGGEQLRRTALILNDYDDLCAGFAAMGVEHYELFGGTLPDAEMMWTALAQAARCQEAVTALRGVLAAADCVSRSEKEYGERVLGYIYGQLCRTHVCKHTGRQLLFEQCGRYRDKLAALSLTGPQSDRPVRQSAPRPSAARPSPIGKYGKLFFDLAALGITAAALIIMLLR